MLSKKNTQGFSLIELMIVVAIISILATLSIPSYQTYTQRARFTEVIHAAQPYKIAVTLALQQGYSAAELGNGTYGIPTEAKATKNLASIRVENGTITATATEAASGASYILKPNTDGTIWTISGTCLNYNLCSN